MELIVQIFKQLPPFWPRMVLVIVLALFLLLPETRRFLTRGGTGARRLERAKLLLEVRKLELEVKALRTASPEVGESILDRQAEAILGQPEEDEELEARPLPWSDRAKLASIGSFAFMMIGLMGLWMTGGRTGLELGRLALKELLVIVPCAFLASAIPARVRWGPVFYGFLIPVLIAALSIAAGRGG